MTLANDIKRLIEARNARLAHQAQIAAAPIDATTRAARIASIFVRRDASTPRRRRILELLDAAVARRDHGDLA